MRVPGAVGALDHGRAQRAADALAARLLADVDTERRDTGVATARRRRTGRDPAAHMAVTLGDEPVLGEVRAVPVLPRRHLGLERGVARGDPLLEDPRDLRPVVRSEVAQL